jgi:alpha-glucosidase (family GH31 glycosyl hydrolase)
MYQRKITLPKGKWEYIDGRKYNGPDIIEVDTPLDVLPVFIKTD